jgi:ribonuclease BN (tRNA processing enzyme)
MSMRLTVIGGAAAWPNAGQACSAYLLQSGEQSILIDCGSGALQELRKHIDYTTLGAIVISHCHSDHILDLVAYRYGLIYGAKMPDRRLPLWLPPGGIERLIMLGNAFDGQGERFDSFWSPVFELREYDPASSVTVGPMTMTFAPTQHFIECYAMRIEDGDGGAVAYSADTGSVDSLQPLFDHAQVGIVEATVERHGETPPEQRGHLTPEDAGRLARTAHVKTLVLTHLWQERPSSDVIRNARSEFDGETLVATPGLTIDV